MLIGWGVYQREVFEENTMKFKSLIPLLDVSDVEKSIMFYSTALGFSVEDQLTWDGKTDWALLKSGRAKVMLSQGSDMGDNFEKIAPNSVLFFYPEDTDWLFSTLQSKGYETSNVQRSQSGTKEFSLTDPDGYILWFSSKEIGNL